MDVDGTLTDGKIYTGESGEAFKAFNTKDGYAIKEILPKLGISPVIITSRTSKIVENRARELNIAMVYQGIIDKLPLLKKLSDENNTPLDKIAYIGDDINDLSCIEVCGFTACPSDSVDEIKNKVDYICKRKGGDGAVREFIELMRGRQ